MKKVSIVIVCMNRMENLHRCLPSITRYTTKVDYEIYVVAYLFDKENLKILKEKYPNVIVIESNEIRGFAENNNLALRQVKTPLTFILNDDTEFKEPVLDKLVASLEDTPDATVMSPVLWNGEGKLLFSGRRKATFTAYILSLLFKYRKKTSKYENGEGIFLTYTVSGAAFLICTEEFRKIGFFNEKYFFCPEDVEVGHKLNSEGKHCYVDANCNIIHYEGVSSKKSRLFYATTIAAYVGNSYFFCNNLLKRLILLLIWRYKLIQHCIAIKIKYSEHHKDYIYIYNEVYNYFKNNIKTKNIFIKEYQKIKDNILH